MIDFIIPIDAAGLEAAVEKRLWRDSWPPAAREALLRVSTKPAEVFALTDTFSKKPARASEPPCALPEACNVSTKPFAAVESFFTLAKRL